MKCKEILTSARLCGILLIGEVQRMIVQIAVYLFLGAAWALFLAGLVAVFWPYHWKSPRRSSRGYYFIFSVFLSVLFLEVSYAVGGNGTAAEKTVQVLSGTLQFFSLDGNYAEMAELGPMVYHGFGVYFYYILFCAYTVIVPIAGGCFILQFLCSVIPRLRLALDVKRTKFVFSELNERSIALAEDIARLSWQLKRIRRRKYDFAKEGIDAGEKTWLSSACLVFTDVCSDENSEAQAELMMRAKRIGAICIKDDLSKHPFHWLTFKRKIVYFLIDAKQEENVTAAISLLTDGDERRIWKRAMKRRWRKIADGKAPLPERKLLYGEGGMDVYVFTQSLEGMRLIDEAKKTLHGTYDQAYQDDPVFVKCVNEYRNVVYSMFDDEKLLDILLSERSGEDRTALLRSRDLYRVWESYFKNNAGPDAPHRICIVIFGGGRIAKEYFKTSAWCLKMGAGTGKRPVENVAIYVFAKNATSLEAELRFEAGGLLEHDCEGHFCDGDFMSKVFLRSFEPLALQRTSMPVQRYLIAFGDDKLNFEAACWLSRRLRERYANSPSPAPTIIDFSIENNSLFEILNEECKKTRNDWCILHPISILKGDCFSYSIIRSDVLEKRVLEADRIRYREGIEPHGTDARQFSNNFDREASVAAALHSVYKWFCGTESDPSEESSMAQGMGEEQEREQDMGKEQERELSDSRIYWLEHRRWLAYMRACGYRCPTASEFLALAYPSAEHVYETHKDNYRRLHACMLDGQEMYISIDKLIEMFAERKCSKDAELREKVKLAAEGKDYDGVRDLLAAPIKVLRGKITIAKSRPPKADLSAWLKDMILPEEDIDALDRLSLLVTLTMKRGTGCKDFKAFDIEISRGFFCSLPAPPREGE